MLKAKFAYVEPMVGNIEVETDPAHPITDQKEFLMEEIELSYPEAVDIEILEIEEIN